MYTIYVTFECYPHKREADGSCSDVGIAKITSPEDSLEIIKELKQKNSWNAADSYRNFSAIPIPQ